MGLLVTKGHRVTLPEIESLPDPVALGVRHKPWHLGEVVNTLHKVADENGFGIVGEDYALAAKDEFPKPIKLGKRSSGWIEEEIDEWIEERIRESRGEN